MPWNNGIETEGTLEAAAAIVASFDDASESRLAMKSDRLPVGISMRTQRAFLVLVFICMAAAHAQQDPSVEEMPPELAHFALWTGCQPMYLLVEDLPDGAAKIGLTRESLQNAAESRLRAARLYDESLNGYLYINVNVIGPAFSVTVEFKKRVLDYREAEGMMRRVERRTGNIVDILRLAASFRKFPTKEPTEDEMKKLAAMMEAEQRGILPPEREEEFALAKARAREWERAQEIRLVPVAFNHMLGELAAIGTATLPPAHVATTWHSGSTGTHGRSSSYILGALSQHLDKFLVEYLRANENDCKGLRE